MRALVTGGAGFVGSHLARRLLDEDWSVLVVDNLSSGRTDNVPDGADLLEIDLSEDAALDRLPREAPDVVFHLASHVGGELSFERPLLDFRSNALATALLLNWALDTGVQKFLLTSSMSVYGDPPRPEVGEDVRLAPKTPYGVAKAASEHLCSVFGDRMTTTALRLFNVYGPGQDLTNLKQGMVSIFLAYVARGEPVEVRGSGERFRDLISVHDAVDAFVEAARREGEPRVYNVGTGVRTRVADLVETIVAAFGHQPGSYPVEYREGTRGDQFGIVADPALIRKELGWQARVGLEEGIAEMAAWVQSGQASAV